MRDWEENICGRFLVLKCFESFESQWTVECSTKRTKVLFIGHLANDVKHLNNSLKTYFFPVMRTYTMRRF